MTFGTVIEDKSFTHTQDIFTVANYLFTWTSLIWLHTVKYFMLNKEILKQNSHWDNSDKYFFLTIGDCQWEKNQRLSAVNLIISNKLTTHSVSLWFYHSVSLCGRIKNLFRVEVWKLALKVIITMGKCYKMRGQTFFVQF